MGDESEYLFEKDVEVLVREGTGYFTRYKIKRGDLYKCTKCGEFKPKSEFYRDKRVPCGIRSTCKRCYHSKG